MDLGLRDSVAFIAGSSRGIGLAIARAFLNEGAKVVVTGRDAGCLEEAARGLGAKAGEQRVLAVPGDMTELRGVQEAFERTTAAFGRLDIVVANVGNGTAPAGWQLSREDWQTVLDANLLGGMVLATEALARMIEEQRGSLVMVSSIAGSEAIGAPVPYSAAKAPCRVPSRASPVWPGPMASASTRWRRGISFSPEARGNRSWPKDASSSKTTFNARSRSSALGRRRRLPTRPFSWHRKELRSRPAPVGWLMAGRRDRFAEGSLSTIGRQPEREATLKRKQRT